MSVTVVLTDVEKMRLLEATALRLDREVHRLQRRILTMEAGYAQLAEALERLDAR